MRSRFAARGLPPETYAAWRDSLLALDVPLRVLAWARRDDDGVVVGSPAVLSVATAARPVPVEADVEEDAGHEGTDQEVAEHDAAEHAAVESGAAENDAAKHEGAESGATESGATASGAASARGEGWRHVGWHEIEHGGWNAESRSLSWTLYGGRRGRVGLREPGRLPELFRERVAASIVVERFVPIRGERGVTVTARRDLGGAGAVTWHSSLTRGLSWSTPGVTEEAARVSAELQSEYGSASTGW